VTALAVLDQHGADVALEVGISRGGGIGRAGDGGEKDSESSGGQRHGRLNPRTYKQLLFISLGQDLPGGRVNHVMRTAAARSRVTQFIIHMPTIRFQDHTNPVACQVAIDRLSVFTSYSERLIG
jgi:hypothetical protein